MDLTGTEPATIVRSVELTLGATWNTHGTILYGTGLFAPLMRVGATGGEPSPMTGLTAAGTLNAFPQFLPDGDQFLFASAVVGAAIFELRLGSLSSGVSRSLMPLPSGYVQVLPPDRLVYRREGELRAQRIDLQRSSMVGTPETLATGVPEDGLSHGAFSVSSSGSIAFRSSGVSAELAWFDRAGRMVARAAEADAATPVGARVSADGTRIALDRTVQGNRDVWILDTGRGSFTRVTSHRALDGLPVWSPDGRRLAYESMRSGVFNLYASATSGEAAEEHLQESTKHQIPNDWSSDGRFLLYAEGPGLNGGDLFALPMTGSARTPLPVASTPFNEMDGRFSPDGRWVAYQTDQSGRFEIVVQTFPESSAAAVQVSVQGGLAPRWSPDGRELYFMTRDGTLMAAEVKTSGTRFEAGVPRALFRSSALHWFDLFQYDVDKTGRFLMTIANQAPPIRLLLNWRPKTP